MSSDEKTEKNPNNLRVLPAPEPQPRVLADLDSLSQDEQCFWAALNALGVGYDYGRDCYTIGDTRVLTKELMDRLIERSNLASWIDGLTTDQMSRMLALWKVHQSRSTVARVREELAPTDEARGTAAIQDWLELVCTEGAKGKQYSLVMMKQWLWQVKRALHSLPRWDHTMLIFQGRQEVGKSTAVQALLAPLAPLWSRWTLEAMADERHHMGLERTYAGYVTELSGKRKTAMDRLKELLTTPEATVRVLGTHDRPAVDQNCSFIADTNESVADVFRDEENRRFWEIRFKPPGQLDLQAVRDADYRGMWYAVGTEDTSPLLASGLKPEIRAAQNSELVTLHPIDAWRRELGLQPGEHKILTSELYDAYKGWAARRQLSSYNITHFGRRLAGVWERKEGRAGPGKRGSYYILDASLTEIIKQSR